MLTSIDLRRGATLSLSLLLGACTIHPGPDRPGYDRDMGQFSEQPAPLAAGSVQQGRISYYADKFHGRKTASGERFDKNRMTAAHPSLPFHTKVEVTNLDNGKSVIVDINDRGPFAGDRILDVSPAAARKLGLLRTGTAMAKIVVQ
ncbi:MAG: septal ring lytic transglycosylase RlpA family protein [Fibrobacteria bacterium]